MITCSKIFSDIPFAHRQPKHDGHCSFVHGHNWSIEVTFGAKFLDCNGFVVDFGKLKYLKEWITQNLDHSCVLNYNDDCVAHIKNMSFFKFYFMDDCSCEGLAQHLFKIFNNLIKKYEGGRVRIIKLTVMEDSKNSTSYSE